MATEKTFETWYNDRGLYHLFDPKDPNASKTLKLVLDGGYELRHSTKGVNFSYTVATIVRTDGDYEMSGLNGKHTVGVDDPAERILAHWAGFCSENERAYTERLAQRRIDTLRDEQEARYAGGLPHGELMGDHVAYVYNGDGTIAAILDDTHADTKRSRLRLLVEASAMAAALEAL